MCADKQPAPTVHPKLTELQRQQGSRRPAFVLRGYVDPSSRGTVGLAPRLALGDRVEVHEDDIIRGDHDDETALATLFISPSAIVSAVSVRQVPLAAVPGGDSKC